MLIIKLLYIIVLAASTVLVFLSDKYQFMVFFVLLLIFPVLSIAELIITVPFVRVKGRASATVVDEKTENRLSFEIRSLMPIFNGILVVKLFNNLTGESSRQKISFSALPIIKKRLILKPVPAHCGIIEITTEKLIIQDFVKLFKFIRHPKIKIKQYILPERIPVDLNKFLSVTSINLDEDKFSEEKSGDDVSEIFGIREYREGDRYRQIHQKLSAKRGILISKEYSLPIDKEVTLICSPFFDSLKNTEHFYDRVYSISSALIEKNVKHTILFKTQTNTIPVIVREEKDIPDMACVLISLKPVIAESEPHNSLYIDGRN